MSKAHVRELARSLGLGLIAELPAAPCLSSRIETGIPIDEDTLHFVHAVERMVNAHLGSEVRATRAVRCRVRAAAVVVELDPAGVAALDDGDRAALCERIRASAPTDLAAYPISFEAYRTGSAFLVDRRASAA